MAEDFYIIVNHRVTESACGNIGDNHIGILIRHAPLFPVVRAVPVGGFARGTAFPGCGYLSLSAQANQGKQGDNRAGMFHTVRVCFVLIELIRQRCRLERGRVSAEIRGLGNQVFLRG